MRDDEPNTTIREMRWETSGGPVLVSFPQSVQIADIGDLESLAAIWLRGLKRQAEDTLSVDGDWAE